MNHRVGGTSPPEMPNGPYSVCRDEEQDHADELCDQQGRIDDYLRAVAFAHRAPGKEEVHRA